MRGKDCASNGLNFESIEKCDRGRGHKGRQERREADVQELQFLKEGKYQKGHLKRTVGEGQKWNSGFSWS